MVSPAATPFGFDFNLWFINVVRLKTAEDIERLAEGGAILAEVLDVLEGHTQPGVTPGKLDELARELLAERGVRPSFLNYAPKGQQPFPAALCVSVNETVVHGLPTGVPLREGDLVGLDLGLIYQGRYFLDGARTVGVGRIAAGAARLLAVTRAALARGIAAARPGKRTGDIGAAIQAYVEGAGFNVVRHLVGHGVGFAVHEAPQVPNFGQPGSGARLCAGLVIAIEPMVTAGGAAVTTASDGWGVVTADRSLSAHEEHTVAITAAEVRVLTCSTSSLLR